MTRKPTLRQTALPDRTIEITTPDVCAVCHAPATYLNVRVGDTRYGPRALARVIAKLCDTHAEAERDERKRQQRVPRRHYTNKQSARTATKPCGLASTPRSDRGVYVVYHKGA